MRVFLAGATGALGRSLVPQLIRAGHEVTGSTRSESKVAELRAAGADGVVMDGLDATSVRAAVRAARPDVVVHQQTALSGGMGDLKRIDKGFHTTNLLRTDGTDHLLAAALEAGATRFVAQSFTGWPNARTGGPVKTEDDPLASPPPPGAEETLRAIEHLERVTTGTPGIDGLALRYGAFYGRGTGLSGDIADLLRKRRLPIVGGGTAVWSVVHIDDAARATLAAIEGGAPGVYNIVDDDPAPAAEILTTLAAAVGAKKPPRLPAWLARPLIGAFGVTFMTALRGASNAKAGRDLGWKPEHPSWRQGFHEEDGRG